ncbi:4a-hydroxytetrahydrobiopterin dehydratase [soil metagenome]
MSDLIETDEIPKWLKKVPEWDVEGESIHRLFEFDEFMEAIEFVNDVAEIAEDAEHHPDIDIRWNKVTLMLTTHSEGGLTENDFELARKIDNLVD